MAKQINRTKVKIIVSLNNHVGSKIKKRKKKENKKASNWINAIIYWEIFKMSRKSKNKKKTQKTLKR